MDFVVMVTIKLVVFQNIAFVTDHGAAEQTE
jgi:hypothetical protein